MKENAAHKNSAEIITKNGKCGCERENRVHKSTVMKKKMGTVAVKAKIQHTIHRYKEMETMKEKTEHKRTQQQ